MKINITKKQYWHLMRSLYMADWMANAICEADMKQDQGIKDIRNYIFSFADELGYEDYVDCEDDGACYAAWDLDDEPSTRKLIKRFEERAFWSEISERLAERDVMRMYSREEFKSLSGEQRTDAIWAQEEKWDHEFEKHGIDRLEIKKAKKDK